MKLRQGQRAFSNLLVPIGQKAEVPAEMSSGFPLTTAYFNELNADFKQFNERCVDELKEMNQTRITNIIDRGGIEGWTDSGNLDSFTKTFEFDSFEQGQAFVQEVGKFCEAKDHHPEWTCLNGGKQIHVKLTSHFANNKVTLFDFELAEHMNTTYSDCSSFTMFPRFQERQLVQACIGVGSFVALYSLFQWASSSKTENDVQRGAPLQRGHVQVNMNTQGDADEQVMANGLARSVLPVTKSLYP